MSFAQDAGRSSRGSGLIEAAASFPAPDPIDVEPDPGRKLQPGLPSGRGDRSIGP